MRAVVRSVHMHISFRTMALLVLSASTVFAQTAAPARSDGFAPFWLRFRDAVARNSEPDVRGMTRLPFLFESKPHDAGGFPRVYAALFDAPARECLTKASPTPEQGMYMAFCGPTIFVFGREGEEWKLTEFAADPEQ